MPIWGVPKEVEEARDEEAVLYIDYGNDFSENHMLSHYLKLNGQPFKLKFTMEKPVNRLRFDPTFATPCILRDFQVLVDGDS